MKYSEEKMWKAVMDCDATYDGMFFYGVCTVGVYCKPSCKSRTPLHKNVRFFASPEEARRAGFRPCKRCHPDDLEFEPVVELVRRARGIMDTYYKERERLVEEMNDLGISSSHLHKVFKNYYGESPTEYLRQRCLDYAKNRLVETDATILDIANEIGFGSLSAFYSFFKKNVKCTPRQYRLSIFEEHL